MPSRRSSPAKPIAPVLYGQVMQGMSRLLAHALNQEISLPVARLLMLVQTAPQLLKLATGWGLEDGRAPGQAAVLFAGRGPPLASREPSPPSRSRFVLLAWSCFSFGSRPARFIPATVVSRLLLVACRRNIVVTPRPAFRIGGLIVVMLLCTLLGIVGPGVGELVR
jgi:hypothetical protein